MAQPPWLVKPGSHVELAGFDPADTRPFSDKEAAAETAAADLLRLRELQERLHVDGRRALLLVLQGMDTSGKDGTVKHLSGGLSLLGARLAAFAAPTPEELRHDFLWRVHAQAPAHGMIGIFNRSHYEDVLVARVHRLVPEAVWRERYAQINAFEALLAASGTTIVKCYLHISKDEQRQRLLARLDAPDKRWKFDPGDLAERRHWDAYRAAYEEALSRCSTEQAPWYVVPADHKWYRNYAVTRLLVEALERLPLRLPKPGFDLQAMQRELK
jgi:PPK2 family polyphosphate:nucleotide phosphotransferase